MLSPPKYYYRSRGSGTLSSGIFKKNSSAAGLAPVRLCTYSRPAITPPLWNQHRVQRVMRGPAAEEFYFENPRGQGGPASSGLIIFGPPMETFHQLVPRQCKTAQDSTRRRKMAQDGAKLIFHVAFSISDSRS